MWHPNMWQLYVEKSWVSPVEMQLEIDLLLPWSTSSNCRIKWSKSRTHNMFWINRFIPTSKLSWLTGTSLWASWWSLEAWVWCLRCRGRDIGCSWGRGSYKEGRGGGETGAKGAEEGGEAMLKGWGCNSRSHESCRSGTAKTWSVGWEGMKGKQDGSKSGRKSCSACSQQGSWAWQRAWKRYWVG